MRIFGIGRALVLAGFVLSVCLTGCAERENEVILDERSPEEIQADYDSYDNQQAEEAYE
jgi:hypothetical protein